MAWIVTAILLSSHLVHLGVCYRTEISLNGDNWIIKDGLGKLNQSVKAHVPGQVHLDLM